MRLPKALTESEVSALYSQLTRIRDRAIFALAFIIALRVSEIAGLLRQNVLFDEQIIRLVGKGGKEAEIAMSNELRDIMRSADADRPPQATHPFFFWDVNDPSKPISRHAIYKLFRRTAQRAGITRRVHPHMARHTALTRHYRSTGDLGKTQKLARHTKIETTTIYAHLTTDDQRRDLERQDRRSWFVRLWSRLRPPMVSRSKPFYIGETLGLEREMTRLRSNVRKGIHTVVTGVDGVGKSHLLNTVENAYRLEHLSPVRENMVLLCEQAIDKGELAEVPKGRSAAPFLDALKDIKGVLVIDSLNDLGKGEARVLRKLAESWTIFAAIDSRQKSKLSSVFYANYDTIELSPFDKKTAFEFVRKAMGDMNVPDQKEFLSYVYEASGGVPRIILDLVEATRRTGNLTPDYPGAKTLSAVPFISLFSAYLILLRYISSSLSASSLKVYATCVLVLLIPLVVLDRVLRKT